MLVLDLSQTSALKFITGSVSNIINRGFPFRFGVVPVTENEDGEHCSLLDVLFIVNILHPRFSDGEAFLLLDRILW